MQVNILRVRVSRNDDSLISKEIVGRKTVSDSSFAEGLVRALTGASVTDTIKAIHTENEGK